VGDLITILGPQDGNLPPKIQSVRCMHMWLGCKTFPIFHIIFENYLYMRYYCVYVPKGGGGVRPEQLVGVCGPLPKTLTLFMTKIYSYIH